MSLVEGVLKVAIMPAAFMFSVLGCLNIKNNSDKDVDSAQCNTFQMFPMKRSQIDSEESTEESESTSSSRNSACGDRRKKKNYRPPNDNETVDECASDWEKPVDRTPASFQKNKPQEIWPAQQLPEQQSAEQQAQKTQTKTARPSTDTTLHHTHAKKKGKQKSPKDSGYIYNEKAFFAVPGAKVQQKHQDPHSAAVQAPKSTTAQKQQQQQQQRKHHHHHHHQQHHDPKHTKPKSQKILEQDPYFYTPNPKP